MSDENIKEQEFKDKELEAIEPKEELTPEDIETLRVDDLQGDIDMDAKYQE
jgi:hypothetical protein